MQTNAYEQVLRGHRSVQPLRNDTLQGFGGTKAFGIPAVAIAIGLGVYAYANDGIQFNNALMMTGGAFLTGWLLGGGALNY